jgi:hypothetical protein
VVLQKTRPFYRASFLFLFHRFRIVRQNIHFVTGAVKKNLHGIFLKCYIEMIIKHVLGRTCDIRSLYRGYNEYRSVVHQLEMLSLRSSHIP